MVLDPDKATVFPAVVLIDQREQLPYSFAGLRSDARDGGGPLLVDTSSALLESGDYTISGYADRVAVERKSLSDLYGTIGQGRDRFKRELERLNQLDVALVVIEADLTDILRDPPIHTKLSPKCVYRSILSWMIRYPRVHWLPCGSRRLAEVTTFRFLEKFWQSIEHERKAHSGKEKSQENESTIHPKARRI